LKPIACATAVFLKLWSAAIHQWSAGDFGKITAKIASDTERMKINSHMPVLKLPLLVDLQQKLGEQVLSLISWSSIILLENVLK
jgi:hypothetical protein